MLILPRQAGSAACLSLLIARLAWATLLGPGFQELSSASFSNDHSWRFCSDIVLGPVRQGAALRHRGNQLVQGTQLGLELPDRWSYSTGQGGASCQPFSGR